MIKGRMKLWAVLNASDTAEIANLQSVQINTAEKTREIYKKLLQIKTVWAIMLNK